MLNHFSDAKDYLDYIHNTLIPGDIYLSYILKHDNDIVDSRLEYDKENEVYTGIKFVLTDHEQYGVAVKIDTQEDDLDYKVTYYVFDEIDYVQVNEGEVMRVLSQRTPF